MSTITRTEGVLGAVGPLAGGLAFVPVLVLVGCGGGGQPPTEVDTAFPPVVVDGRGVLRSPSLVAHLDAQGLLDVRVRDDAPFPRFGKAGAGFQLQRTGSIGSSPGIACVPGKGAAAPCQAGVERDDGHVKEWVRGGPEGIEHGFVVEAPPPGGGTVRISLRVSGASLTLEEGGQQVAFQTAGGRFRASGLVAWDTDGMSLRSSFEVEDDALAFVVDTEDARFPVTIDPLIEAVPWTSVGTQHYARLGVSAALGDVNADGFDDLVAGQEGWDSPLADAGRAVLFLGSAEGLATTPAWALEGTQNNENQGQAVAVSDFNGDGFGDIALGAPFADVALGNAGRVMMWLGGAGGPGTVPVWQHSPQQLSARFGTTLAAPGDVDGDGRADLVVGEPYWNGGPTLVDEGRVHLIPGDATLGLLTSGATVRAGGQANAYLGLSLCAPGDVTGDARPEWGAVAPGWDGASADVGRIQIWHGAFGPPAISAQWVWSPPTASGDIEACGTAGDVDGDGFGDLLVTAPYASIDAPNDGIAWILGGSATGLSATPLWSANNGSYHYHLGIGASGGGDLDGDGRDDVILGSETFTDGQNAEGALEFHSGAAMAAGSEPALYWEPNATGEGVGPVLATGDVDGDGGMDLVVGAPYSAEGGPQTGRLWALLGAGGTVPDSRPALLSDQAFAALGAAVARAGDTDGDGFDDALVAAPAWDGGQGGEGAVWLHLGTPAGLSPIPARQWEGGETLVALGSAIAHAGDVDGDGFDDVALGAPFAAAGGVERGRVELHLGGPLGPDLVADTTLLGVDDGGHFGAALAAAGDLDLDGYSDLFVGAPTASGSAGPVAGRAFVFSGSPLGPPPVPSFADEGVAAGDTCGTGGGTVGDLNGDGWPELAILDGSWNGGVGRLRFWASGPAGLEPEPTWTLEAEGLALRGSFGAAVDWNGDGFADVPLLDDPMAASSDGPRARIHLGSPTGPTSSTPAEWLFVQPSASAGAVIAGAGDLDGDGFGDVVVGLPAWDSRGIDSGRVVVWRGEEGRGVGPGLWEGRGVQALASFGAAVAGAGDLDGDGYGDLLVGSPALDDGQDGEGAVFVTYGAPPPIPTTSGWQHEGSYGGPAGAGEQVGQACVIVGDVDGDGFDDIAIGSSEWDNPSSDEGAVRLFYGGPTGPGTAPDWEVESDVPYATLGASLAGAGDVNGDGYADLIAGGPTANANTGLAWLWLGSPSGPAAFPDWSAAGAGTQHYFGQAVDGAGDVDQDGFADVLVGEPLGDSGGPDRGRVVLFFGSSEGLAASAGWSVVGAVDYDRLGTGVAGVGDLDGDGFDDIGATEDGWDGAYGNSGRARLWLGSATGPAEPAWTWSPDQVGANLGTISAAGDTNGDGFDDVALGAWGWDGSVGGNQGLAAMFLGSALGLPMTPDWTAVGGNTGDRLGATLARGGDVDGDGFADLVVGAPYDERLLVDEGSVSMFRGSDAGLAATPAWVENPHQMGGLTGAAVGGGGDVDGDGFDDFLTASPSWDGGAGIDSGRVRLWWGSGGGTFAPTLRRPFTTTPVPPATWSQEPGAVAAHALALPSPLGFGNLALELETAPVGTVPDGSSVAQSDPVPALAAASVTLDGLDGSTPVSARVRVVQDRAQAPIQRAGPWRALARPGSTLGRATTPTSHNLPPTVGADSTTTLEGGSAVVDVLANDSDGEQVLDASNLSLAWPPMHGTAAPVGGGMSYFHDGSESGTDSFGYQICDAGEPLRCVSGEVSVTITLSNDPPSVADEAASLPEAEEILVDVLSNDADEETALGAAHLTVLALPSHGMATVEAGGIRYVHGGGEVSTDTLGYEVCDGGAPALCAEATLFLTILLENDVPTVVDDLATVDEGGSVDLPAFDNDSDGDDPLSAATVTLFSPPTHGAVSVFPTFLRYAHDGSEGATDTFVYRLCDPSTACGLATVHLTVTPQPDAPLAWPDGGSVGEGLSHTLPVLANDTDADSTLDMAQVLVVRPPQHGTAEVQAGGILYTHDDSETSADDLRYRICDDGSLARCAEAEVTLSITLAPDPLVTEAGGPYTVAEGGALSLDGTATYDGDGVVLSWVWDCTTDGSTDGSGALFAGCSWADDGLFVTTLVASSSTGESVPDTAMVSVTNVAPQISSSPAPMGVTLTPWSYVPSVEDPGAETFEWALATAPGGMVVDPATGELSWTPTGPQAGTHDVVLTVSDGDGGADVQGFSIVVGTTDADGDGDPDELDCDDADPTIHQLATEVCDGIDQDCDGVADQGFGEWDGDGLADCVDDDDDGDGDPDGLDCAPLDAAVGHGLPEICDLLDQDCDPGTVDWIDADGDGLAPCDGDCDDGDTNRFAGAPELCNGLDDDCDPATAEIDDLDGDLYSPCEGDCWEGNPAVGPGVIEACDGFDADCDGELPAAESDIDGDGFAPCEGDCDDGDPTRGPVAAEICDGIDQDCDGEAGPPAEDDPDLDGRSLCDGDCGPFTPWIGPGQAEICDGLDGDCDGAPSPLEGDGDGDGWTRCAGDCDDEDGETWPGAAESVGGTVDHNCDGFLGDSDADGDGWTLSGGDCHDGRSSVHPGAAELCDGWDTDCDGAWPPEEQEDLDGDGAVACLDCGPADPLVGPQAEERCNGLDDDCDGAQLPPGELDLDDDGLNPCGGDCDDGDPQVRLGFAEDCEDGLDNDCEGSVDLDTDHDHDGHSSCSGDCRDFDEGVHPGAPELCDGTDDDCDLEVDEGWDLDGDGQSTCAGDCDDDEPSIWLGAPAQCDDGFDNDCLPSTQELIDGDGDGFAACDAPGDCWEGNPAVFPDAAESCNGADDDCDGQIDEGWDGDGDNFRLCAFDCADTEVPIHPGVEEVCDDGIDDDCDGEVDEGCEAEPTPAPTPPPAGCQCDAAPVSGGAAGVLGMVGAGLLIVRRARRSPWAPRARRQESAIS